MRIWTADIVGCKKNDCETDRTMCLEFFYDCSALTRPLVKDYRRQIKAADKAGDRFPDSVIVTMNNEDGGESPRDSGPGD